MAVFIYKDSFYTLIDKNFQTLTAVQAKKERVGALVPLEYITALTFKLPRNLDEEQLALQIELKMYNEGGLDPNKEYAIDWIKYELENEESYLIESFALDQEEVSHLYAPYVKEIGFIDILFPKFIAYKASYTQEFQLNENHLILSIWEDEAFSVIFQKGKYIGYRQIDSLNQIAQKLGYEVAYIKTLLVEKGLVEERYSEEEKHIYSSLVDIFYKNVEKIVYAINFKRSFFGLDKIDRVLIDFEGNMIEGLRDLFLSFGLEGEYIFEPYRCCGIDPQKSFLATAINYVEHYDTLDQSLNLSFFERKKPIYSYQVVQYALLASVPLLFLLGVWAYLFFQQQALDEKIEQRQNFYEQQKRLSKKYIDALARYKKKKSALAQEIDKLQKEIDIAQDTLSAIPFIVKSKEIRQQMINDIVAGLYRYRLSTKAIEQKSTKYADVDLISNNDQRAKIAKFMEYLLQKRYKDVFTKKIEREKDFYESKVRIVR